MKLKELLRGVEVLETTASEDLDIAGVAYDSRKVTAGGLFVAVSGFQTDGNRFIPMALEKGAAAVVTAKKPEGDVPYILVPSDRLARPAIQSSPGWSAPWAEFRPRCSFPPCR